MQFRSNQFSIPEVTKNIIIINVLLFLGKFAAQAQEIDLDRHLAMFYPGSPFFKPWQMVSHIFMHGNFTHLLFNMFAIWMFGARLEQMWGPKRFLQFYFFSALGAFLLHFGIVYFQIQQLIPAVDPAMVQEIAKTGGDLLMSGRNYTDPILSELNLNYHTPVLGASGAVFGILVAFAMYWPNTELYLLFLPIPIKAKYAVMGYAAFELFSGISGFMPGIAHFAHLGGALFGFLLVKYWNKNNRSTLY